MKYSVEYILVVVASIVLCGVFPAFLAHHFGASDFQTLLIYFVLAPLYGFPIDKAYDDRRRQNISTENQTDPKP